MTISYVWVTVAAVTVLEILALAINGIIPGRGIGPGQLSGRLISSVLVSLLIAAPIGGLFRLITTRGLVRRLHSLVRASTRFADGDYVQRVPVARAARPVDARNG
jgi:HAMP domain-containing protein